MVGHIFNAGRIAQFKTIILSTPGTDTWTVPTDWDSNNNTIELIGGGQAGGNQGRSVYANGGGGGDYAKGVNVSLTPGASITYNVAAQSTYSGSSSTADVGQHTWFDGATVGAATISARGGGASEASVGDVVFTGGLGGRRKPYGSGGGGGCGGPFGVGGNGGPGRDVDGQVGGGGGGGASGGTNGEGRNPNRTRAGSDLWNGDGGKNRFGTGEGTSGNQPFNGGGGRGGVTVPGQSRNGQNGSSEAIWTSTVDGEQAFIGAGGGALATARNVAGNGANYGGGGGGQYGVGAQGVIVIRYLGSA